MKAGPEWHNLKLLCDYHDDMGHSIEDCRALKWFIIKMIKEGHFKEYLPLQNVVQAVSEMPINATNLKRIAMIQVDGPEGDPSLKQRREH